MAFSSALPVESLQACCWSTVSLPRPRVVEIGRLAGAHAGSALVESCQRLEAYSLEPCNCLAPGRLGGAEALFHLAEVAAGLHSVVLGEREILGQVRQALVGAPAPVRGLGEIAISAARDLRRETRFEGHAGHLLDRALRMGGVPTAGNILILGTGQMGRLVAERAVELGFAEVVVAGRRAPAQPLPGATFAALSGVGSAGPFDVIAGCLGSNAPEVRIEQLPPVRRLLLDLGTPRNFAGAPAVASLMLADLLADEQCERPHATRRRGELRTHVRTLVERRLERFAETGAAVTEMRMGAERIRQREVERIRRLHPEIPADAAEQLTRSLVNQLLHGPTASLRASGDAELARAVARLFSGRP